MKSKEYHTVGTIPKSERGKFDTQIQMHNCSLSWLGNYMLFQIFKYLLVSIHAVLYPGLFMNVNLWEFCIFAACKVGSLCSTWNQMTGVQNIYIYIYIPHRVLYNFLTIKKTLNVSIVDVVIN